MIDLLRRGLEAEVTVDCMTDALAQFDGGVPGEDLDHLAKVLTAFVQSVPDALAHALALSKDARCGRAVAFAIGTILTYLMDPEDLIAESTNGPLGLLDDSYLAHVFVTHLTMSYPFAESGVVYRPPSGRSLEAVAALLPDGVAQSLARTSEAVIGVAHALIGCGSDGRVPEFGPDLDMRVAEAIHTLARPSLESPAPRPYQEQRS
jgi:uncharacterized membrane protein YkvA (DUF1232 family)